MSRGELDKEIFVAVPAFAIASLISLGLVEATFIPWVDITETLFELGDIQFSIARGVQLAALGGVVINRDASITDELGFVEIWTVYACVGLILAPPFFPFMADMLNQSAAGLLAFGVQTAGVAVISILN